MAMMDQLIGLVSPAAALRRAKRMRELGQGAEAFPLVARAARAGFADAEFWVAQSYLEGSGVPASRPEGVRWLKRAATHGSVDAQALLSSLYLQGLASEVSAEATNSAQSAQLFASDASTAPDFEAAATWARRAAGAGSAQGQALLGYILTSGPESIRNLDEAHRCYELGRCRLPTGSSWICLVTGATRKRCAELAPCCRGVATRRRRWTTYRNFPACRVDRRRAFGA